MAVESVVVWKWKKEGYRSKFTGHHVNVMRNMVARHYRHPHRFICITDDPEGIDEGIEIVPLWNDLKDVPNPTWPSVGPSCYRRLKAFSKEFEDIAGKRFVSIDLDVVITRDLSPLWNRPEDFVIYASAPAGYHYNGSMWMMTTGCRSQVWETFDPRTSPQTSNANGHQGSDQGWIQYVLGKNEARWTIDDGIFAYKRDCQRKGGRLPNGARLVVFHGKPDPWDNEAMSLSPWISEYYQ
jgi:hypothetical protein